MLKIWDYELSVYRVSEKVSEWKIVSLKKSTLTADICRDLYVAREQLDSRGLNRGNEKVPNGTFLQYLEDVGLAKSTVHRWLEHYDPLEQRLLTNDELEEKQPAKRIEQSDCHAEMYHKQEPTEAEQAAAEVQAQERVDKIIHGSEVYEQIKMPEASRFTAEQEQELEQWKKELKEETKRNEEIFEKEFSQKEDDTSSVDNIRNLLGQLKRHEERKVALHKKIRLTGDNAGNAFNQVLIEYLDSLSSDSERLEACHNGIKIFKSFIRDYQMSSAVCS
jgi:hypothetical protein